MNDKTIAKNSNAKTKLSGIDSAPMKPFSIDANLLKVGKVECADKFGMMKIDEEVLKEVTRGL